MQIGFVVYGQQNIIAFKNDSVIIQQTDSIYYQTGDEYKGELKYGGIGRWKTFTILKIDDGFIISRKNYFSNGKIRFEYNYKKGKLDGEYNEWNENGILIVKGYYSNGYKDSVWTFYYSNGVKETEGRFIADMSNLLQYFRIERTEENVSDGTWQTRVIEYEQHSPPHGEWNFYDKKGQLTKTLTFEKGVVVSIEVGDHIGD